MIAQHKQSGFTAVELLITLFVAAAFLIAGYQLFNVVIKDGGQARAESTAGNVAYDYLRRYAPQATNPCTAATVLDNAAITVDGLSNVKISVAISCPPGYTATGVSKVEATITYNTPQQTSKYSTFTNGIAGNTPLEVTDGLVAWWKLNGNTNDSSGNNHGTGSNLTPTTGQNGLQNSAYSFNGTNSYIDAQVSSLSGDAPHSISFWIKITAYPTVYADPFSMGNAANNSYSAAELYTNNFSWYFFNNDTPTGAVIAPLATWTFVTLTYSGGGGTTTNKKIYRNATALTTVNAGAGYGQLLALPTPAPVGIGRDRGRNTSYFNGVIDDVRIYNRALSQAEVTTLYNGGAK